MPVLRCTVRGCDGALVARGEALACPQGHTFDRAREGYWNLLQPQDRKSRQPGDPDEAVAARRRWLGRGFVSGLVAQLATIVDGLGLPRHAVVVDAGCGEGTITTQLFGDRDFDVAGIDLSARAVALAARSAPGLTWIVANADRGLPFPAGSVALAVSIFGRRPAAELARVLAPGGAAIVVVPGDDDLIELRELSQGEARRRDRVADVLGELSPHLTLTAGSAWRDRVRHDREALEDALTMSYRARASARERLGATGGIDVTLSAAILVLVPPSGLR